MTVSPSCLDTTELTVEKKEEAAWLLDRRNQLDKLKRRLTKEGRSDLRTVLDSCGEDFRLVCKDKAHLRIVKTHCKKRWCPMCAPMLAAERCAKVVKIVSSFQWPLIVNLTVQNVETVTAKDLRGILKSFRKFRQRGIGKLIRGGFASCEVTHTGNGWHPHLHIICDCEWLSLTTRPPRKWQTAEAKKATYRAASEEMEREWSQCVGQKTSNVFVQRVNTAAGAEKAAREQIKYTLKGEDLAKCEGSAGQLIDALKKVRLYRGFGSCYRLKPEELEERTPCACEKCGCVQWIPEELHQEQEYRAAKKDRRRR